MGFSRDKIEKILGIKVSDSELFKTAFTHRSYLNEHPTYTHPSNERLEFLGDAVLQLISSDFLYRRYPSSNEGVLTNYRAAIVCTPSLAEEAKRLGYGELLFLSNGEETSGGREREYILANTFEAVLGALYLDKGMSVCIDFVQRELLYKIEEMVERQDYKDAKSTFQEISQEKTGITPVYKVVDAWGADHDKTFRVAVFLDDKIYGQGEGASKQRAEQNAALEALDKIKTLW